MAKENQGLGSALASFVATMCVIALVVSGWVTHLFWTFRLVSADTVTAAQVVMMVVGIVFPPIGAIHGFWLWFN